MLETVDLTTKLGKQEYKRRLPKLQRRLHHLQRACHQARLGSVVVFEGWDTAGKGTAIRKLTERLEPRAFRLHAIQAPRTHELHMPWMWRFWLKVPNWGEIGIFDRSWYGRVLVERVDRLNDALGCERTYPSIRRFERALADDHYEVIKFFLHISHDEQRRRLESLEGDPLTAWMVEPEDWQHHEQYEEYRHAIELMLERTETEWAPWTIVEATDKRWCRTKVFDTMIQRLEHALAARGFDEPEYMKRENWEDDDHDEASEDHAAPD